MNSKIVHLQSKSTKCNARSAPDVEHTLVVLGLYGLVPSHYHFAYSSQGRDINWALRGCQPCFLVSGTANGQGHPNTGGEKKALAVTIKERYKDMLIPEECGLLLEIDSKWVSVFRLHIQKQRLVVGSNKFLKRVTFFIVSKDQTPSSMKRW